LSLRLTSGFSKKTKAAGLLPSRRGGRPYRHQREGVEMATQNTRALARWMMAPSVGLLLIWMIVPLAMTLWFSFQNYNLLNPGNVSFAGLFNYQYFYTDPAFFQSIWNTLIIVVGVLFITVIGGIAIALMLDQPMWGQGLVRILVISPFFVMPPVAALVWKNMIMHPQYGVFADISRFFGVQPVDWFGQYPLFSIIIIVAWQWLPFATLILLTALQSLDGEQKEAAEMDGANFINRFIYLTVPHLARSITVVILIQTIFLLGVYAEILVTTNGGPGYASTNLPFLIYRTALLGYDVGGASAGGIIAVILANIVAFFLMRAVGKNLDK
jgi:sorbitol/mannitol transport system permease protein